MKRAVVIGLVAAVIVIGGVLILARGGTKKAAQPASSNQTANQNNTTPSSCPTPKAAEVVFCDGKFTDATVKSGQTVTFTNASTEDIQVDSDPHPVHTDEPELNVGLISPNQSQTAIVTKSGVWGFHNHLSSSERGTLTVQ